MHKLNKLVQECKKGNSENQELLKDIMVAFIFIIGN